MHDRRARGLIASLAVSAALAVAGCGGGGGGGGASVPEAADLIPASVPAFVSFSTDFQSEQWQNAKALLERVPGGAQALEGFPQESLGPEAAVGVLGLDGSSAEAPLVLVAKPDDPEAFELDLAGSDDVPVWQVLDGGWYVVADDEQTLDLVISEARAAPLSEDELFRSSVEALPEGSLGLVYVDGEALGNAFASGLGQTESQLGGALEPLGGAALESLALALTAESEGVRLDGVVRTTDDLDVAPFSPELTALVPGDALAYAAFGDVRTSLEALLAAAAAQEPDFETQLAQVQLALGVSIEQDVFPLFSGEHALFVRAGVPVPEVTLILSPEDPQRALATLDKLVAGVPLLAQTAGDEAPFTVKETTIAGVQAKQLDFPNGGTSLVYAAVRNNLVLSTAPKGVADVVAGGGSIADDEEFRQATEAAGVDDEITGLLYVNLQAAGDLAGLLGDDAYIDPEMIRPLRSVVLAGTGGDTGEQRFQGFLAID